MENQTPSRLLALARWARRVGRSWVERARGGEYLFLLFVAAFIGLLGGLGAIAFSQAIHFFQHGFWGFVEPRLSDLQAIPAWKLLLVPAGGGLLVGLITTFFAPEAKGHGVPQVIKAVALKGAIIRGRVAIAKTIASAITIGSGGSAGREGPVIQIGAAIGSRLGQAMGMPKRSLRTLVACGAAAGIAGTFNAPIAGALFSVEVILGEFGAGQFSPIVISSVVATVVTRAWRGDATVFTPPACTFASAWELIPYVMLGLLCGLASFAYIRGISLAEEVFDRQKKIPPWLRPAIGGLLIGALAMAVSQVMGDGQQLANAAFAGTLPALVLIGLAFAKMLATGFTLGSGGSGGVFSPALSIGALLGAGVGTLAAPLLGGHFGGIAAYSVVGMGGLIAGAMLAPITSILMIFEITSNYALILPIMIVAIVSTSLVMKLTGNLSIYTYKLARQGIHLFRGRSPDLLQSHRVGDHMRARVETIRPEESATALINRLLTSDAAQFYVVDSRNSLLGAITLGDARRILLSSRNLVDVMLAEDVMRYHIPVVLAGETLSSALAKFAPAHLQELPVVRSPEDRRILGTLDYSDVLAAYQDEVLKSDTTQALSNSVTNLADHPVGIAPGFDLVEWEPPVSFHGQTLAQVRLPDTHRVRVLLFKRRTAEGKVITRLPSAQTVISPRDTLILLGTRNDIARTIGGYPPRGSM